MKKLLFLTILLFLPSVVSAQLCGSFGSRLNVHDANLKPIEGVKIQLPPPPEKRVEGKQYLRAEHKFVADTEKPGNFTLKLSEGLEVSDAYPVTISAPGFQTIEREFYFPHCQWISQDITMLKPGEKSNGVSGKVTDETGAAVSYARLTFQSAADQSERFIHTDREGDFAILLAPGEYRVTAEKMYFHTTILTEFRAPEDLHSDIKMEKQKSGQDKLTIEVGRGTVCFPTIAPADKKPL